MQNRFRVPRGPDLGEFPLTHDSVASNSWMSGSNEAASVSLHSALYTRRQSDIEVPQNGSWTTEVTYVTKWRSQLALGCSRKARKRAGKGFGCEKQ